MGPMVRFQETLRRLAMIDEGFVRDGAGLQLGLAGISALARMEPLIPGSGSPADDSARHGPRFQMTTTDDTDWRARGACISADPELFFPVSSRGPSRRRDKPSGHAPPDAPDITGYPRCRCPCPSSRPQPGRAHRFPFHLIWTMESALARGAMVPRQGAGAAWARW